MNGYRKSENCIPGFNLIVIDVDEGITIPTAQDLLKEYKWLMYTTKRHTETNHRFRIIFPTSHTLKLDENEYKEFMKNIYEWLPFKVDDQTNQRSRKWLSHNGQHWYNEGELLDVLPFIPKTSKNDIRKKFINSSAGLDNLQRWFLAQMLNGERNNHLLRYALLLKDNNYNYTQIRSMIYELNNKLPEPLSEQELNSTVLTTLSKSMGVI